MKLLRHLLAFPAALIAAVPACVWTRFHERRIIEKGRRLTDTESKSAQRCGVNHPERIRVLTVERIPNPLHGVFSILERASGVCVSNAAAITFRYGIYLTPRCGNDAMTLRHECVHTGQYERLGGHFQFLFRYIRECLTHSYADAPLEREAREGAARCCRSTSRV